MSSMPNVDEPSSRQVLINPRLFDAKRSSAVYFDGQGLARPIYAANLLPV